MAFAIITIQGAILPKLIKTLQRALTVSVRIAAFPLARKIVHSSHHAFRAGVLVSRSRAL